MAYIIENVNFLKESELQQLSILVKHEQFYSLRPSLKKFSFMRVDANPFIMTRPHILFCPDIPMDASFQMMKAFFLESFIYKGCTMFLTYAEVEKEYLVKTAIKNKKKSLLNSPIDYTIGVKLPLQSITPSMIRVLKKEKIPAIFIEIDENSPLENMPWGWIREAMFPYNSPLIPIFTEERARLKKATQERWATILKNEKIPHLADELIAHEPISHPHLCQIGIYPVKSGIHQGGEVSYNFYLKASDTDYVSEVELYHNHQDKLSVTVHKGTVIRADREVLFRPGYGEYVPIHRPMFFKID